MIPITGFNYEYNVLYVKDAELLYSSVEQS